MKGRAIDYSIVESQQSLEGSVNFRSYFSLLVLIISASTACAQDARKTADDFGAKWVATNDAGAAGNVVWAAGDYGLLGSGEVAGKQTGGRFGWVLVRDGDVWRVTMLTANVS